MLATAVLFVKLDSAKNLPVSVQACFQQRVLENRCNQNLQLPFPFVYDIQNMFFPFDFQITNPARGTTSPFCKLTVGNVTLQSKVLHNIPNLLL